jgi:GTP-binding protein
MFVDKVKVKVAGGDGGDGVVSFRHEKFIDRGGPDGGDGGDGGDIVAIGSTNQNTLASFRFHKELIAKSGHAGAKQKKHGRRGGDLEVKVPIGTVMYDEQGTLIADITQDGQRVVVAKGGKGGYGNAHFVSSRRQAPKIAEKGEPGVELEVTMELKLIAEVGLVGLPNAGKSTLLARISNAKPEIADYPFTTTKPNLGVADLDNHKSLLVADIPGLIKGASAGRGLGDEFLRHIERTKILIHVIDAYQEDVTTAYLTIRQELKAYRIDLSTRQEVVALNKIDGLDEEIVADQLSKLRQVIHKNTKLFPISAVSGHGVRELLFAVAKELSAQKEVDTNLPNTIPIITLGDKTPAWSVRHNDTTFTVTGPKIERFAKRTNFDNPAGIDRLRDIMRKMGIMHELERQKINPGDQIVVGSPHEYGRFEY